MEPAFFNRSTRLSVLLLWICAQSHGIMGQPPTTGFISLDCGGSDYSDPHIQGLYWTSDESYVHGGKAATVGSPTTGGGSPLFTTFRYFPGNQTKFCYTLPGLSAKSPYLVRASFWYGTQSIYETMNPNQLTFKLLIDADVWASIFITLPQTSPVVHEIYVLAMDDSIAVCLSGEGIGFDIPFISAIELRPLDPLMDSVQSMILTQTAVFIERRLNYGVVSNTSVRYPDDHFDRIWYAMPLALPRTYTDREVQDNSYADQPPVPMLKTAVDGDGSGSLDITLPIDVTTHNYSYALYFAEIDSRVNSSGQRMFEINLDGNQILEYLDIYFSAGGADIAWEFGNTNSPLSDYSEITFSFKAFANSTYGPLLNGLELLRLNDTPQSNGTFAGDVSAIQDIMKAFRLSGWAGDPCLPYAYNWLNCTQQPSAVRITALVLSNQSLVGTIPPSINDLTELVQISLDQNELQGNIPNLSALKNLSVLILNNNNLSGTIPDFLSQMPALETLLLQYNNFSGQVSQALLRKRNDSSLDLEYAFHY